MIDQVPTKKQTGFLIIVAFLVLMTSCIPANASVSTDNAHEADPMVQGCLRSSAILKDHFYLIRDTMTRQEVIHKMIEQDHQGLPQFLVELNAVNLADSLFNSATPKEAYDAYSAGCLDMIKHHIRSIR